MEWFDCWYLSHKCFSHFFHVDSISLYILSEDKEYFSYLDSHMKTFQSHILEKAVTHCLYRSKLILIGCNWAIHTKLSSIAVIFLLLVLICIRCGTSFWVHDLNHSAD